MLAISQYFEQKNKKIMEELCHDPMPLFDFPNCCQRWNVEITIGIIAFAKKC